VGIAVEGSLFTVEETPKSNLSISLDIRSWQGAGEKVEDLFLSVPNGQTVASHDAAKRAVPLALRLRHCRDLNCENRFVQEVRP